MMLGGMRLAIVEAEAFGGRGKVMAIEGNPVAPTSRNRTLGMRKALAAYPGIELLELLPGNYLRPPARQHMAEALARHRQIDGIWSANDLMALGALEALAAAGRTARIVGANGLPEAIAHIENGTMLASVDFSPFTIAGIATRAALRHLAGKSVPREIMVPAVVIDRTNCAAWKVPLAQRPCPAWDEIAR
jgi:ribose transport system substrate-binding protein